MSCLCGHFESCDHCRPKQDDPEVLRRMTKADWERSITVHLDEDPKMERVFALARTRRESLR